MKKLLALLMTVVLIFSFAGCGDSKQTENISFDETSSREKPMNGVFRYANWGDSIRDVEKAETATCIDRDEESLFYEVELLAYNATALYFFDDNGFKMGSYTITDSHTNPSEYIDDFDNLKELLTEKYGRPYEYNENWSSDSLKSDPGLALSRGDVEYTAMWKSENVEIMLNLASYGHHILNQILYTDPNEEG